MIKRLFLILVLLVFIFFTFKWTVWENLLSNSVESHITEIVPVKYYNALQEVNFIQQGSIHAPHKIYVFFDPNSLHCNLFYLGVKKLVERNYLAIRWVPIGFLKDSSLKKAISILSATNRVNALEINQQYFNYKEEEGGIDYDDSLTNNTIEQEIYNNMNVIKEFVQSIPFVIYKNKKNELIFINGVDLPIPSEVNDSNFNVNEIKNIVGNAMEDW